MPGQTVPRRGMGTRGPAKKAIALTPPSKKVCLPPRRGALVQWSSGPTRARVWGLREGEVEGEGASTSTAVVGDEYEHGVVPHSTTFEGINDHVDA